MRRQSIEEMVRGVMRFGRETMTRQWFGILVKYGHIYT